MTKRKQELNTKQKLFLRTLEATRGIVTAAEKKSGISRTNHYRWMDTNRAYKKAYEFILESNIDFAETKLREKIDSGDTTSILFFLKCKAKHRGYIERASEDPAYANQLAPTSQVKLWFGHQEDDAY